MAKRIDPVYSTPSADVGGMSNNANTGTGAITGPLAGSTGNKNNQNSNQQLIENLRGQTATDLLYNSTPNGGGANSSLYPNANSSSLQGTIDPDRSGSADVGGSQNAFQEPTSGTSGGGSGTSGWSGSGYTAQKATYTAPTLPSATSQEEYINAMYDANQKAQEEALKAAYEKNLGTLDYQQSQIAPTYNAAANDAGAQAAIQRANFNESANASGLNTGTGSQAELSMRNAEAANISAIRKAQADAQADLEQQRSQLAIEYQSAIREAIAQNELNKAQALYEEAKRVDESLVSTAINQANLNWQVWQYNNR